MKITTSIMGNGKYESEAYSDDYDNYEKFCFELHISAFGDTKEESLANLEEALNLVRGELNV